MSQQQTQAGRTPWRRPPRFVDAEELAKPGPEQLAAIAPGSAVKVAVEARGAQPAEAFWLEVAAVDGERIVGTVDNHLSAAGNRLSPPFHFGEVLQVERRHVLQVLPPAEDAV